MRNAMSKCRVLAAALVALTTSCRAEVPTVGKLSAKQVQRLEELAHTPVALGVTVTDPGTPRVNIHNVLEIIESEAVTLDVHTKPFRPATLPLVRVKFNGKNTIALLDTGASVSVVDYWGADRMKVHPIGPPLLSMPVGTLGGRTEQILAIAPSMKVGPIEFARVPLGILNDARGTAAYRWLEGFRVETILGNNVLSAFGYASFDLPHEEVTLATRRRYIPNSQRLLGETPVSIRYGVPTFLASIDGKPVTVGLDTGGAFGLWFPRPLANALKLPEVTDPKRTSMGEGVAGAVVTKTGSPRTLNLVGFDLPDLPSTISMVNLGDGDPPYALLGVAALQRYVVTVDYGSRMLYFEKP